METRLRAEVPRTARWKAALGLRVKPFAGPGASGTCTETWRWPRTPGSVPNNQPQQELHEEAEINSYHGVQLPEASRKSEVKT